MTPGTSAKTEQPVVLWQTVGNFPPWHLGTDENMQLGARARIIIEQPGWNADGCQVSRLSWSPTLGLAAQ
jgi:hypothetical protein